MPKNVRIEILELEGATIDVQPAQTKRLWMDQSPGKYAYRCLPLTIANSAGWEIICPDDMVVQWNGGSALKDTKLHFKNGVPYAKSHFGGGIVTFFVQAIIKTSDEYSLYVTGPANSPKDGISPLTGIIESYWSNHSFTMNWKITAADKPIFFSKGEPFARFFPVDLSALAETQVVKKSIISDPDTHASFMQFTESRNEFNSNLSEGNPDTVAQGWQRHYFRGQQADSTPTHKKHYTKLRLKPIQGKDDGREKGPERESS